MFKRWVCSIALLMVMGWSGIAHATLTVEPPTVEFMTRPINGPAHTLSAQVKSNSAGDESYDQIVISGTGCSVVSVTPTSGTANLTTPQDLTVTFDPVERTSVTCIVMLKDSGGSPLASFTVTGTGIAPVISVPMSTSFGSVRHLDAAATPSASEDIVIQNTGDDVLNISTITLENDVTGDYAITTNPAPATVMPGNSVTVSVTFNPTTSGTHTADLEITSDDPAAPTALAGLTGEGTNAVASASNVDFGVVTNGTTSPMNVVVANVASAPVGPLHVTSATITDSSGWFTFGGACTGTSCTIGADVTTTPLDIPVQCTPSPANATGMRMATVTLVHDGDSGTTMVALTCVAGRPVISVDENMLAYGDVVVGTQSVRTINVTNDGNRDLTYDVTKTGMFEAQYTLGGSCFTGCTVAPNTTESFTVTFAPDQAAQMDITVTITSNDPDAMTTAIPVTGRGVRPEITGPADVALGDVELGAQSTAQPLTITNSGTSDLTIASAVVHTGASDYTATGTAGMQVVAPGGQVTWNIVCHPQAQGARPGTFQIVSDAQNTPTLDVPLTCNGTRGFLEVDPTSIAFGDVQQDTIETIDVTLRNTGNLDVTGITATVNPDNIGYRVVAGTLPPMLIAGGTATVTIEFAPTLAANGGPATVTFAGAWGTAPTPTSAQLAVTGGGLTNGYTVSETAIDFGEIRFDETPTRTFCITNTGESSVTIESPIVFTPTNGTASNEFAITQIQHTTACGTAGTTVTLPQTLATGDILEVTVRAQPANRTGPLTGELTIASDLPTNPDRTVALAASSITAMLTLVPGATVDLGDVDIQGGTPAQTTVRIRNTGAAPLDVGSFTRTANPAFTFTLPADTTIPPAGEISFVVTYDPTVASASPETVTITHAIAGDINAPAMGMIVLSGRGIDRDLTILAPLPEFPDTFRNPGDAGPVRNVSIQNSGTAPLQISAVMASDSEIWNVLDPDPITIPPGASMDVRVRFEPTAPGTHRAVLQIVNDDDDDGPPISTKVTEVMLEGNCVDRRVSFNPTVINLGYVEVGDSVTLPEALIVTSMDDTSTFTIQKITIDGGDGAFAIDGTVEGVTLDRVAMERRFDITFTPTAAGQVTATAQLFLDTDPVFQSEIELQGTAVFVDARGGGGCATTNGTGAAMIVLVLVLVLRRRAAALALAVAAAAPVAHADDDILLSVFDPTPATTTDGFHVQSPVIGAHGAWVGSAVFSYAQDPLLHLGSAGGDHTVITGSSRLELGGAVALLDKFEVGASMPFYSQTGEALGDRQMEYTTEPAEGTAIGDLRVHGKVGLVEHALDGDGLFALAGSMAITLPTATEGMLTGVDSPSARVLALVGLRPGAFENRVTLTANVGAVIRAPAEYQNLEQKSGLAWGLGTAVRVADPLWLAAEMFGELSPSGRETMSGATTVLSPIEWLAGLRWRPDHRVAISLAAGRGLTSAAGAPALRGVFALTLTPGAAELRPIHTPPPPVPDVDSDGDGLVDRIDQCDDEAEDVDLYNDTDGCPERDNDGDGIADADDKCALDAEDKDGFEDADGCADKDNDRDAIVDVMDKCPMATEDRDGFQDSDGCPERDNDRDGIVDADDRCPNEPEAINGSQDHDGCPDPGMSLVIVTPDRLDLMDAIRFRGTTVSKASFNLLGQIAATLRANPDIVRVRIGVHVVASRSEERDQQLSEKRAEAIRQWLVEWGIAEKRLDPRGFGSTKPLGGPRAADERVELVIMERN